MAETNLPALRDHLQRRRRQILETSRRARAELEALRDADRDPEFEEGAQREHEQYTLSALSETQRRELVQIDAAIARVDAGTYGTCTDCGQEIDPRRLEALPYALQCTECAARAEQRASPFAPPPPTL